MEFTTENIFIVIINFKPFNIHQYSSVSGIVVITFYTKLKIFGCSVIQSAIIKLFGGIESYNSKEYN